MAGVVAQALNPSTQRQADLYEFKASLIYKRSPRLLGLYYTEKLCLGKIKNKR